MYRVYPFYHTNNGYKKGRQSELRNLCCAGRARKWLSEGAGREGRKEGSEHGRTVPGMTVPPAEHAVFHPNGTPFGENGYSKFQLRRNKENCDCL